MWEKIIIPMYRLWLHSLYGLYGPQCPLSPKRPINLISLSLSVVRGIHWSPRGKGPTVWSFDLFFAVSHYHAFEQTVELLVTSDALMLRWHHCNAIHHAEQGFSHWTQRLTCNIFSHWLRPCTHHTVENHPWSPSCQLTVPIWQDAYYCVTPEISHT